MFDGFNVGTFCLSSFCISFVFTPTHTHFYVYIHIGPGVFTSCLSYSLYFISVSITGTVEVLSTFCIVFRSLFLRRVHPIHFYLGMDLCRVTFTFTFSVSILEFLLVSLSRSVGISNCQSFCRLKSRLCCLQSSITYVRTFTTVFYWQLNLTTWDVLIESSNSHRFYPSNSSSFNLITFFF